MCSGSDGFVSQGQGSAGVYLGWRYTLRLKWEGDKRLRKVFVSHCARLNPRLLELPSVSQPGQMRQKQTQSLFLWHLQTNWVWLSTASG